MDIEEQDWGEMFDTLYGEEEELVERYEEGVCNCCGTEVEVEIAELHGPDEEVYTYDCDGCENEGFYLMNGEEGRNGVIYTKILNENVGELSDMLEIGEHTTVHLWRGEEYRSRNRLSYEDGEEGAIVADESANTPVATIDFGTYRSIPIEGLIERVAHNPYVDTPEEVVNTLEEHWEDPDLVVEVVDSMGYADMEDPTVEQELEHGEVRLMESEDDAPR